MPSLKLKGLTLPSNVFCSPLAGCSDFPFRKMIGRYRPGLMFCEMVKMDALIRHDPHTYRILDYSHDMHPIGAQLCGSKPQFAGPCARILEDLGFDLIDLNCGCPVDKVTKDGSGSGLLKVPELIGELLSKIIAAVKVPVTVKIRTGWDSHSINAPEITKIAEEAGAQVIFVHGRTRAQGYNGPAEWSHIRNCVNVAKTIHVFGNGDIVDVSSAESIFRETGCHGILLSRGTFGQPWIFEDIARFFEGLPPLKRTGLDLREGLIRHMEYISAYQPERRALLDLRRVGAWYFKRGRGMKALKGAFSRLESLETAWKIIEEYPWEELELTHDREEGEAQESAF